ncbi:RNA-binding domain-containing protein [Phascolarctobacterium succinatutens]|jgi:ATP-dependent DNA helicase RecG|uniref:RNA-binding domain-containing protein n=1 Tax=Phascolarctobacterium succinatutens TaxID=626940 RepID=UPI0025F6C02D|nr:RNA-binding domain-containing protein [Phascolarctobacterium succinatutens]
MLPKKETLEIEFKSDVKRYPDKDIIEAVSAMANTNGGILYLGVEDNGIVTGLHKSHMDAIGLVALIANNTIPSVSVRAEIIIENQHKVMKIATPMSRAVVSTSSGKILKRRLKLDGSPEAVPMYAYEITSRLSELSLLDVSAQPIAGATLDDFDPLQLNRLKEIIRSNPSGEKTLLELTDEELEFALRLISKDGDKVIPTMTGLLLLGKTDSLARLVPTAKATFQVLEGTNVKVNEETSKPILEVLELFQSYIKPWNSENEFEYDLFRIPVPEFSYAAIREGLINAFCHRDYSMLGNVRVLIDDEGMSITNPGGFIEGVNINNLLIVEPHGRNPALTDALKRIGLAEKTGRGIDRIFEGSIVYGRPLPDYSESTSRNVRLYLRRAKADIAFAKLITSEKKRDNKGLSIYALMILSCLREYRRSSLDQIAELTKLPKNKLTVSLEQLVERGTIEAVGKGKTRSFMLCKRYYYNNNSNMQYVRQSGIDDVRHEELVIKLARTQNGIFTKRDVMELLGLSDTLAYNLIKRMTANGEIELSQSGRYAKYKIC